MSYRRRLRNQRSVDRRHPTQHPTSPPLTRDYVTFKNAKGITSEALVVDFEVDSVWDFVVPITSGKHKGKYIVERSIAYYSLRYSEWIIVEEGDKTDGATKARDINSFSWLLHDDLCEFCVFQDGRKCTNWMASMVCSDILKAEDRWFREYTWLVGTFLFGGKKIKKTNGWY
jgi:hypothetical protein